jgi:hypothetical protein
MTNLYLEIFRSTDGKVLTTRGPFNNTEEAYVALSEEAAKYVKEQRYLRSIPYEDGTTVLDFGHYIVFGRLLLKE